MADFTPGRKRLDEEFPWEAEQRLLHGLRRLMHVLEARFGPLEGREIDYESAIRQLQEKGVERINVTITPLLERITNMVEKGFLLAHSDTSLDLTLNAVRNFTIDDPLERQLFTPSAFVTITRMSDFGVYAVAQVLNYDPGTGFLQVSIKHRVGAVGPFADWEIAASPGTALAALQARDEAVAIRGTMDVDLVALQSANLAIAVALS